MLDTLPPEMIPIRQSAPTPGRIDARARTAGIPAPDTPSVSLMTFEQAAREIRRRTHLEFITADLLEAATARVEKTRQDGQ